MFEQSQESFIDLKSTTVVHLYHSLNEPTVSVGDGLPPQVAKAHLLVTQSKPRIFDISIGLFFPETSKRVLYKMPSFQVELLNEKLGEAEAYAEQMGFIMDNTKFERSSAGDKENLLRTVPFVYQDVRHFYQALSQTELKFLKAKSENSSSVDNQKLFLEQYLRIVSML